MEVKIKIRWEHWLAKYKVVDTVKQIVSFSGDRPVIDNEFHQNINCQSSLPIRFFDNVMTKLLVNNRTDGEGLYKLPRFYALQLFNSDATRHSSAEISEFSDVCDGQLFLRDTPRVAGGGGGGTKSPRPGAKVFQMRRKLSRKVSPIHDYCAVSFISPHTAPELCYLTRSC